MISDWFDTVFFLGSISHHLFFNKISKGKDKSDDHAS